MSETGQISAISEFSKVNLRRIGVRIFFNAESEFDVLIDDKNGALRPVFLV